MSAARLSSSPNGRSLGLYLGLALTLSACAHRAPALDPLGTFEALPAAATARERARSEPDPKEASGLAWLAANDAPLALEILSRALEAPDPDPGLLLRRALIWFHQLAPAAAHADLLRVLEVDRDGAAAELALTALVDTMTNPPPLPAAEIARALDRAPSLVERANAARRFLAARLRAQLQPHLSGATGSARMKEEQANFRAAGSIGALRARGPLAPSSPVSLERPSRWELTDASGDPAEAVALPLGAFQRDLGTRAGRFELGRAQPEGLYVAGIFLRVPGSAAITAELLFHTHTQARVRLDGAVLVDRFELDEDLPSLSVRRVRLEPGWHHLGVSALSQARSGVALHLLSESGQPLELEESVKLPPGQTLSVSTPLPAPEPRAETVRRVAAALGAPAGSAWVRAWLTREALGLVRRDLELARRALIPAMDGAPDSALFTLLGAHLSQQSGEPRALVEARLRRALASAPELPSLLFAVANATLHDDPERALALAERLRRAAPESAAADELAFRISDQRGWYHEAELALIAAAAKNPPPSLLEAGAGFYRRQFRLPEAERMEEAARQARGGSPKRDRVEAALETGDLERAITLLERRAARAPDPTASWARIAELQLLRGEYAQALRAAERIETRAPWASVGPELAATALAATDSATSALARLRRLRDQGLEDQDLEVLAARLEGRPPGEPRPGSPLAARLAYDALAQARAPVDPRFEGFREVRLLDRVVDYVRPSGHALSLRHSVTRLDTKEATDRAGEFRLPERALSLELRTVKADGRIVEVDEHEGKEDLSFSALAPGDSIERKWLVTDYPTTAMGGYSQLFFFRDDVPTLRSELFVVVPTGTPVRWRTHHGAPAPEVFESDGDTVYLFARRDVPGMRLEPASAPYTEFVPFVEVSVGLEESAILFAHRSRLLGFSRSSYPLREKARALVEGEPDPMRRVERIFRFVATSVRPGPTLLAGSTLALGRGHRTILLHALLREAGFEAELILARGGDEGWVEPALLDPSRYGYPMVRVEVPGQPRPLFADLGGLSGGNQVGSWLGRASTRFRGGRYLRLGDPEGVAVEFRDEEVQSSESTARFELELGAGGDAQGSVLLRFDGWFGSVMKERIQNLQNRELLQSLQGFLSGVVPGTEVHAAEPRHRDDPLAPLELEARVTVHRLLVRENGAWVSNQFFSRLTSGLMVGLPPLEQLIQVPRRESPMRLYGASEHLVVRLRLPTDTPPPSEQPETFAQEEPWGRFEQSSRLEGSTLHFQRDIELHTGQVSPGDYPRFYGFVQDLALRMRNRLRVELRPETATHP